MAEDKEDKATELDEGPVNRKEARLIAREEADSALEKATLAKYRQCPGCGNLIPKQYHDCPRCKLIYDESSNEWKPAPPKPPDTPTPEPELVDKDNGWPF